MPVVCCVKMCGNRSNREYDKSYYRLPCIPKTDNIMRKKLCEERRQRWVSSLKRADITESKLKNFRVCEDHFITGKPADLQDVNHPDWIPSQNMGYPSPVITFSDQQIEDVDEGETSEFREINVLALDQYNQDIAEDDLDETISDVYDSNSISTQTDSIEMNSIGVQTDLSMSDLANNEKAYQDTVKESAELRCVVAKMTISEETFKNDDEKTRYYTGIKTYKILMIIFDVIKDHLPYTATSYLTPFQQFMLTLMHLRLNLELTDLAYRFKISTSTVSRCFVTCISIMYRRFDDFLFWPERDALMEKVPDAFLEAFGRKVAVIIDCFEIFIERPSNLMAAAQTWSNYKHHHTIKYLIGICPQGAITFISSAWGGRSSDKYIARNCGILDKLLPGDIVLCDRGFNIKTDVEYYFAEVKLPAFTRGKNQLSPIAIEESRSISNVRIHIERVIGILRRRYKILHETMPISTVSKIITQDSTLVDRIVKVCCCLTNISPSVVPFDKIV